MSIENSKTEGICQALLEKQELLARRQRLLNFLKNRVSPRLPVGASRPWTKEEEERVLGYGEHGEPVRGPA